MNYDAFMEPITWVLTGMEKHSDEFQLNGMEMEDKIFPYNGTQYEQVPTPVTRRCYE